jgi:hypothetical protein
MRFLRIAVIAKECADVMENLNWNRIQSEGWFSGRTIAKINQLHGWRIEPGRAELMRSVRARRMAK